MNRETKFRAWDKNKKKFEFFTLKDFFDPLFYTESYHYDDYEFEEYTGLKDKNGKEIYEGDIVESKKEFNSYTGLNSHLYAGNKYEIKNNGWRFYLEPKSMYSVDLEEVEVIGNIYENPELLTNKQ